MTDPTLNRLLSDPSFIELDISLKRYNVFRSLKIQDYEIRHSKFLGHLLNPNETHGLGAEFLTNFLLCLSNSTGKDIDISELDLDLTEVKMEWSNPNKVKQKKNRTGVGGSDEGIGKNKRLDILIRVPLRYIKQSYYDIAVEMKWRAKQHKGQLSAYTIQLGNSGIKPSASILLTINGEEPEEESRKDWQGVTYQDVVVPALRNTLQKGADSTSQKVINTLEDWLEILVDETDDGSIEKAGADAHCEKLLAYKAVLEKSAGFLSVKYPAAYEKLKTYIEEDGDTRGKILKYFKDDISKKFVTAYSNRTYLRFYPSKIYPFAQNIGGFPSNEKEKSYPLIWELLVWEVDNEIELRLLLTLAKLDEEFTTGDREDIAARIRGEFCRNGQRLGKAEWSFTNTTITDNFTRIIRSDWESSKNTVGAVRERIDGLVERAAKVSEKLESLLKDTCLSTAA